jgi:hypothetical protein
MIMQARRHIDRCVLFIAVICMTGELKAQTPVDFTRTFQSNGMPLNVNFRAWAPSVDRIRGVVISLPGTQGDARGIVTNLSWRHRLETLGFAVLGVQYAAPTGSDSYFGYGNEISPNVVSMLSGMAASLGRPEINNAPIILEGYSHGAHQAQVVSRGVPDRTLGYIADKGSTWNTYGEPTDPYAHVPGLMIVGHNDTVVPSAQADGDFFSLRYNLEARVALQVDWTGGHGATSIENKLAFINQLNRSRYPSNQLPSLVPNNPLIPVDVPLSSAWLGEPNPVDWFSDVQPIEWPKIDPAAGYQWEFGPYERSWLPTETAAAVYRAHNAVPYGIGASALSIAATNATNGVVAASSSINLNVAFTQVPYTSIEVFWENQSIALLGPSLTTQQVIYNPSEGGLHTFVAVAKYILDGKEHFTSKYITVGVPPTISQRAGDFDNDGNVDGRDFLIWQRNPSIGNLSDWQGNYGAGPLTAANTAVPEPSAGLLATLSLLCFFGRHGAIVNC